MTTLFYAIIFITFIVCVALGIVLGITIGRLQAEDSSKDGTTTPSPTVFMTTPPSAPMSSLLPPPPSSPYIVPATVPSPPPPSPLPPRQPPPTPTNCMNQPDGQIALRSSIGIYYPATCVNGYVMLAKLDGRRSTWYYESPLWNSTDTLNPNSFALDLFEAKLEAYNLFSLTKIRVGMMSFTDQSLRWLDISLTATYPSMRVLMNAGYQSTTVGRSSWLTLVGQNAALQNDCNQEGFDVWPSRAYGNWFHVRIGIVGNEGSDTGYGFCGSPDSSIGFGIMDVTGYAYGGTSGCPARTPSVGNYVWCGEGNPYRNIPTFGYLLGQ